MAGKVGWNGISNTMVRQVVFAKLMEITDVSPTCTRPARCEEGSAKEQ